jgi:hypothetical protein
MKKIISAIALSMAFVLQAQAAEFSTLVGFNVDTQKASPGIAIGTRVSGFGVGYGIVEFQRNDKVSHAHIFSVSRDLYSKGDFAAGLKGGTAYLSREAATDGWVYHYSIYGAYKLADNYRIGVEYLQTRAPDSTLRPTDSSLVVASFRYRF